MREARLRLPYYLFERGLFISNIIGLERKDCSPEGRIAHLKNEGEEELLDQRERKN